MTQGEILETLRKFRGQKLTVSQITSLLKRDNRALVGKQLRKLRDWGMVKSVKDQIINRYYYYV